MRQEVDWNFEKLERELAERERQERARIRDENALKGKIQEAQVRILELDNKANAFRRQREKLNAEEVNMLKNEITLAAQRRQLTRQEAKLRAEVKRFQGEAKSFDERWASSIGAEMPFSPCTDTPHQDQDLVGAAPDEVPLFRTLYAETPYTEEPPPFRRSSFRPSSTNYQNRSGDAVATPTAYAAAYGSPPPKGAAAGLLSPAAAAHQRRCTPRELPVRSPRRQRGGGS